MICVLSPVLLVIHILEHVVEDQVKLQKELCSHPNQLVRPLVGNDLTFAAKFTEINIELTYLEEEFTGLLLLLILMLVSFWHNFRTICPLIVVT